ncbi:MAG TPA: hypothetical protein PK636_05260 [bacterium]|nr:hypothetical protein [bacterium]HPJ72072.1 hypothetical protein [bacterium]HPQ72000.1 hypothetical protein [bacterium]
MKLWNWGAAAAGWAALTVSVLAADSHPTASSGDFSDQEDAMQAPGYSYYQCSSTCADGNEFEAWSEWYGFEPLPFSPATGKFRYLYVKWKEHHVANKGVISMTIEYSRDGGSTWRTLVADTYTSGLSTSAWQETVTALPILIPWGSYPYDLGNLVVRAGLTVEECCPGLIGSYGGGLYIKEIKVTTSRP